MSTGTTLWEEQLDSGLMDFGVPGPPTISVVMPAFNAMPYLLEAVLSVRAQSLPDWELVVADDGSTDGTAGALVDLAALDPRLRVVRNTEPLGPGPARNRAIEVARGRYLAFLDSDDLWVPDKLERQLGFMRETGCPFTFASFQLIDETGAELGIRRRAPRHMDHRALLGNTAIGCLTVMIDRQAIPLVQFPDLKRCQDLACWLELLRSGLRAEGLDIVLGSYRIRAGSNSQGKLQNAWQVWGIYREREGLPAAQACWHMLSYICHAAWMRLKGMASRVCRPSHRRGERGSARPAPQ